MLGLLKTSIILTIGIVCVFLIFGFLLGMIEKRTSRNLMKKFGEKSIIITGIVGTSIHELSHYVMAKIFFHKVTGIKLFTLKIKSNELGHVRHSYNKNSYYQRAGNFFIGIAPIVFGTAIIILLFRLLLPESWTLVVDKFDFHNYINLSKNFNLTDFTSMLFEDSLLVIKTLFSLNNILSISFWIFLFLAISISTHMSLSGADFKGSFSGIIFVFIFSFMMSSILIVVGFTSSEIIHWILTFDILVITFLVFAVIFSLISYVISIILSIF